MLTLNSCKIVVLHRHKSLLSFNSTKKAPINRGFFVSAEATFSGLV